MILRGPRGWELTAGVGTPRGGAHTKGGAHAILRGSVAKEKKGTCVAAHDKREYVLSQNLDGCLLRDGARELAHRLLALVRLV
jgi:hypothetical protein